MADVTVPRAGREEMRALPPEAPTEPAPRSFTALPRLLMILWAALVLGIIGFLVAGTLRIGAGNRIGRRMPVREIWSRFLSFLTDFGAPGPLLLLVAATAITALVLAALALWLAFGLRDAPSESVAETPAEM